jgi:hypothetical protein
MTRCSTGVVALVCILCLQLWNGRVGERAHSAIGEKEFASQHQLRRNLNINKTANATHTATSTSNTNAIYYHTLTSKELGHANPDVTVGNPLKGFVPSPDYSKPPYLTPVPHSLEFYYIGT